MTTIENQTEVVAALKAGRAMIDSPEKWTKGEFARDINGESVLPKDHCAVCFCSYGAAMKAARAGTGMQTDVFKYINRAAPDENIIEYNDFTSTTHQDILVVWDKAIEKAEAQLVVLNLERLIEAVEAQPEVAFNLSNFRVDHAGDNVCGTLFCTVGLACTLPEFIAVGFNLKRQEPNRWDESGDILYRAYVNDADVFFDDSSDPTFGEDSFGRLFDCRDCCDVDSEHPSFELHYANEPESEGYLSSDVTDKDLALWRLNKQLAIYKEKAQ